MRFGLAWRDLVSLGFIRCGLVLVSLVWIRLAYAWVHWVWCARLCFGVAVFILFYRFSCEEGLATVGGGSQ